MLKGSKALIFNDCGDLKKTRPSISGDFDPPEATTPLDRGSINPRSLIFDADTTQLASCGTAQVWSLRIFLAFFGMLLFVRLLWRGLAQAAACVEVWTKGYPTLFALVRLLRKPW